MNVLDAYNFIQKLYPQDRRNLNSLAWPLDQHHCGVQFVDKDGRRLGPIVRNPTGVIITEPLGGPFYSLPVIGICPILAGKQFSAWKQLRFVVELEKEYVKDVEQDRQKRLVGMTAGTVLFDDNGNDILTLSSLFFVRDCISNVKGLAEKMGISWYYVGFNRPMVFTRLNIFDEWKHKHKRDYEDSV